MDALIPTPAGRSCPVCGEPVAPQAGAGRPRRYCSSKCKSRADRQRRTERALSPAPATKPPTAADAAERLRVTRALTREAAIELVAADPEAMVTVLARARPMIASPVHRASRWREVAVSITALAAMVPAD